MCIELTSQRSMFSFFYLRGICLCRKQGEVDCVIPSQMVAATFFCFSQNICQFLSVKALENNLRPP